MLSSVYCVDETEYEASGRTRLLEELLNLLELRLLELEIRVAQVETSLRLVNYSSTTLDPAGKLFLNDSRRPPRD